ncbi:DUF3830 family protein [Streptomyces misionensis]|uniref:DUF3830 family protein n=2 Tax=Streptomyces misionensis TaxID=67331 RepID=UPI0033EB6CC2
MPFPCGAAMAAPLPQRIRGMRPGFTAGRCVTVPLHRRNARCRTRPSTGRASLTCAAVRNARPPSGEVRPTRYTGGGICALFPPLASTEPPPENPAVTPAEERLGARRA